jgi:hypothetical protein
VGSGVNVPSGYVMNPPMLRPLPIGSLQWILVVGSPDPAGVEAGVGELTELFGVAVVEAAGPHEVTSTSAAAATRRLMKIERHYSANDYAAPPSLPSPEMGRAGSARGEARLSDYSDCCNHFATAAVRVWSEWLR